MEREEILAKARKAVLVLARLRRRMETAFVEGGVVELADDPELLLVSYVVQRLHFVPSGEGWTAVSFVPGSALGGVRGAWISVHQSTWSMVLGELEKAIREQHSQLPEMIAALERRGNA